MTAIPKGPDAAEEARRTSARVERLLQAIQEEVAAPVWAHVDEMVRGLVTLYGAGLARTIDLARDAGGADGRLREALAGDELVSSLLLLHGLHPYPPEERIRRRLNRLHVVLAPQQLSVRLEAIDDAGTARLRVDGAGDGRTRALGPLREMLVQAVEEAAPEIAQIVIEGLPEAHGLVQIRSPARARTASLEAAP